MTIIQFIIVIFAAGVLAADKEPAAIVSVPVFWSVWMLHAIMTDYDTLKYAALAKSLEKRLNASASVDIFRWESELAVRDHGRPLIFQFSYLYWGFINVASWVMAVEVLRRSYPWVWSVVVAIVGAIVWLVTIAAVAGRSGYRGRILEIIGDADDAESTNRDVSDDLGGAVS